MKRIIVLLGVITILMSCKKKHCVTCTEDNPNGGSRVQFYQECGVRGNAKGGEIANRELDKRSVYYNPECTILPE